MDSERTGASVEAHSGPSFVTHRCSASFSLTSALQAAVAAEEGGEDVEGYTDEEGGKEVGSGHKRKRECTDRGRDEGEDAGFKREEAALQAQGPTNAATSSSTGIQAVKKSRKQHWKDRKKLIRAAEAQKAFAENTDTPHAEALKTHLGSMQNANASIDTDAPPANWSGYKATFKGAMGDEVLNYDKLIAEGYKLVEWDGVQPLILSAADTETVFAVGVAKPAGNPTYEDACKAVAALFLECGATGNFTQEEIGENLRGPGFMALNFGIGAEHGPPEPYNLCTKHPDIVDHLRSSMALERLAQHHSAALKFYFPELYNYYHEHTMPVRNRHRDLIPNWVRSIFCATAVNLGPEVATYLHRDGRNLAFGQCAIQPFGKYDYKKGGHLVLKEPKLIIQFPLGCIILIPSATITHGNTPIQPRETRVSFTQYTAGALFRYVDAGFSTLKRLRKRSKKRYADLMAKNLTHWEMGMGLWPTLNDLSARASGSTSSKGREAQGP